VEECVSFLKHVKTSMAGGSLAAGSTPLPPKHKRFDESQWAGAKDDDGNAYYVNSITHESIWEDEFNSKKNHSSNNAPSGTPAAVGGLVSVTKETFESRMATMQAKMEEQLVEQLKSLENKISSPVKPSHSHSHSQQNFEAEEASQEAMLAKKEMEIIRLNKQILDIQSSQEKSLMRTASLHDVMNGGANNGGVSSAEFEAKVKKISELMDQNVNLQAAVNAAERMLSVIENKSKGNEERVVELEADLSRERKAKEEAMDLFNSNDQVTDIVNKDVVTALEAQRKDDTLRMQKLEVDLKKAKDLGEHDLAQMSDALKQKEALLGQAMSSISNLKVSE